MIEAFSGRHWPNWSQDCSNNAKIKTKTRCPQKPLSKLDSNIQIWNVSIFEVRLTGIYILSLTFTIRCINRRDHSMNADWSKGLTESCRNISSVHWLHRDTKRRFSVRFEEKSKGNFLSRLVQLIYILPKWLYLDMPEKVWIQTYCSERKLRLGDSVLSLCLGDV